jgi:hypothetical protein
MGSFTEQSAVVAGTDSTTSISVTPRLGPNSSFRFQLVAENSYGRSAPAISESVKGRPPYGVARLRVLGGTVAEGIVLSWDPDTTGVNYTILRSADGQAFHPIAGSLGGTLSTYTDRSARGTSTVYYQIVSQNYYGNSPPTQAAPFVWALYLPPKGVTGASAATLRNGTLQLRWTVDPTALKYVIRKSIDGVAFAQVAELPSDRSEYQDRNPPRQEPSYQIVSINHYGPSQPIPFDQVPETPAGTDSLGPVNKP